MFARSRRGVDGPPTPTPGVRGAQKTAVRTKLPLWRKRAPLNGRRPLPLVYSTKLERKTKTTATQPSAVATQLFIINVPMLAFFHSSSVDVSLCCLFSSSAWSKLCWRQREVHCGILESYCGVRKHKNKHKKCCVLFFCLLIVRYSKVMQQEVKQCLCVVCVSLPFR